MPQLSQHGVLFTRLPHQEQASARTSLLFLPRPSRRTEQSKAPSHLVPLERSTILLHVARPRQNYSQDPHNDYRPQRRGFKNRASPHGYCEVL
jgi:hypothetical protein